MTAHASGAFLALMERIELFTLGRAWTDLTDEELFWEPTPSTWSVRRAHECRTPRP